MASPEAFETPVQLSPEVTEIMKQFVELCFEMKGKPAEDFSDQLQDMSKRLFDDSPEFKKIMSEKVGYLEETEDPEADAKDKAYAVYDALLTYAKEVGAVNEEA
jgi:hypothetical protein